MSHRRERDEAKGEASPSTPARLLKPYPAYKDSGSEWLSAIPAHWETARLKRVFSVVNGSTPQSGVAEYWDGEIPWVTPEDLGDLEGSEIQSTERRITGAGYQSCGTALAPAGSLVLSTRAPIGHLAIAGVDLCTNQGCRSLVFRRPLTPRFFYFQILAARPELESLGQGSTFKELAKDKLEGVLISEPPDDEQRNIAAFLDRETARIDALVANKERLIERLQERRTALITSAVTKGLDPNVPMKDSGVEWVGEVPTHWEVLPLKRVLVEPLSNGLFKKREAWGSGTPIINVADLYRDDFAIKVEALECVEADVKEMTAFKASDGDLFFVRSSLKREGVGASACLLEAPGVVVFECHLVRARPNPDRIIPQYLAAYANASLVRQRLVAVSETTTMTTIAQPTLGTLDIVLPPLTEQKSILASLATRTGEVASLIAKTRDAIDRVKELRTALISAAVTGKIDVREA